MTRWKKFVYASSSMVISLLGFAAASEVVLRCLPVANNPVVMPVSASAPVFHYKPNQPFVFSRDWNLRLVNHGRTNNAGMVNDQEYRMDAETPVLAVIGDSYIEAKMVPYRETLQGRLAAALNGRMRVYSFGASGAPMSQYLIWARYAVREYNAKALIINIVGNDFDESHDDYKRDFPGFWIYVPGPDRQLRLQLYEFRVGAIRSFLKHSALMRYLLLNMQLEYFMSDWHRLRAFSPNPTANNGPLYFGNTAADSGLARMSAFLAVLDAFFRDLREYAPLPPDRILFTMDGFRYPASAADGAGSYFDQMRRAFKQKAEASQYEVLDLDPFFFAHFREHGSQFQDSRDLHWNATGHGVVAGAVLQSRLLTQFHDESPKLWGQFHE